MFSWLREALDGVRSTVSYTARLSSNGYSNTAKGNFYTILAEPKLRFLSWNSTALPHDIYLDSDPAHTMERVQKANAEMEQKKLSKTNAVALLADFELHKLYFADQCKDVRYNDYMECCRSISEMEKTFGISYGYKTLAQTVKATQKFYSEAMGEQFESLAFNAKKRNVSLPESPFQPLSTNQYNMLYFPGA